MPDYKELYFTLIREAEKAVRILIEAQKACEELYLNDGRPVLQILPTQNHTEE